MRPHNLVGAMLGVAIAVNVSTVSAKDITIVTWNASPTVAEGLESRLEHFKNLADHLNPDIFVLVEIAGDAEAQTIAHALGWKSYHGIASNWAIARTNVYFALETAIISKIPIEGVIEYDASPDGHHEVFTKTGKLDDLVREERLESNDIPGFGKKLQSTDRGTMRVDLENGLSIFPLHLKSNRNSACADLNDTIKFLRTHKFAIPSELNLAQREGFPGATTERLKNAAKRERVMAATARLAAATLDQNRIAIIAGDMNTAFELGKAGDKVADCDLQEFTCSKGSFPSSACGDPDGFDDTLGMLENGLIAGTKWTVLTKGLGRTYDDSKFSDLAIDHIAVPYQYQYLFTLATKASKTFGSDHFPVITVFRD